MRRPDPIERDPGGAPLSSDILPIFRVEDGSETTPRIASFCGTGFRVADVLVTCWHCVAEDEPEEGGYAVAHDIGGEFRMRPLLDVARDLSASDLATARIFSEPEHALPGAQLALAQKGVVGSTDVWTYGYPLTEHRPDADQGPKFILHGRYLEGYVTRTFWYSHPTLGDVPSYELDLPAPEGLSGAPLVKRPGLHVIGVIYGRHEVALVDEFSRVDPMTGETKPEVQRIFSFGLACDTSTLVGLRGPATNDLRLVDYVAAESQTSG